MSILHSSTSKGPHLATRKASASFFSTDSSITNSRLLISLQVELPNEKEEGDTILPAFLTQGLRPKKKEIPTPTSSAGRQIFGKVNEIREIWQKNQPSSLSGSAGALPSGSGDAPASALPNQQSGEKEMPTPAFTPPPSVNVLSSDVIRSSSEQKEKSPTFSVTSGGLVPVFPSLSQDRMLRRGSANSNTSLESDEERNLHFTTASAAASGMAMFSNRSISGSAVHYPERPTTKPRKFTGPLGTTTPTNAPSPTAPSLSNGFHGNTEKPRKIIYQNHHNVLAHPPSPSHLLKSSNGLKNEIRGEGSTLANTTSTPKRLTLGEKSQPLLFSQKQNMNTKEDQEKSEKVSPSTQSLSKKQEAPAEISSAILSSSLSLVSRFSEQVNQQVAQDVFLDNFGFYMSREEKAGETALLRDPAHRRVDYQWISFIFPKWDTWSMQERKKYCRLGIPPSFRPPIWRALLGVERVDDLQERGGGGKGREVRESKEMHPPPLSEGKNNGKRLTPIGGGSANSSMNHPSGGRGRKPSHHRTARKQQGGERGEGMRRSLVSIEEYETLCQKSWPSELEEKYGRVIERDIPRTFSTNIFFDSSSCVASREQEQLRRVLRAYCLRNEKVRYCQGMASVAATFLLVMGDEYEAFLCFTIIMEESPYHLEDYYAPGFPELERSSFVLSRLTEDMLPSMHQILQKMNIPFNVFATPWLLTIFSHCFNFRLVCRIWDMFLCEGWKPVYRVVLSLLKMEQNKIKKSSDIDFISISMILQHATEKKDPGTLLKVAQDFKFSTKEMLEYRKQYKPPR